jgi:hypothetical protein
VASIQASGSKKTKATASEAACRAKRPARSGLIPGNGAPWGWHCGAGPGVVEGSALIR